MKKISALLAALLITACVGVGMLALGASALLNPNGVAVASSPAFSTATEQAASSASTSDQVVIQQLQQQVAQYQQREQQYQQREQQFQTELETAQQQLQQASEQLQQYQNLLEALQERGLIAISRDGRIFLPDR